MHVVLHNKKFDINLSCVLTRFAAIRTQSLLNPTLSYKDFKNVDMVIEAVFEDIKIKHAVIKEVEQVRWKMRAVAQLINNQLYRFCNFVNSCCYIFNEFNNRIALICVPVTKNVV